MTEALKKMPLFEYNSLLSPEYYEISKIIIETAPFEFFQTNFNELKGQRPNALQRVDHARWNVENQMTKMNKKEKFGKDELTGLRIATHIASDIDLIYHYKLRKNLVDLKKISENLVRKIDDLPESEAEFQYFLSKYPKWIEMLNLIKKYVANQTEKSDLSQEIYNESTRLSMIMAHSNGPQLFFLPLDEDPKVLGDKVEKKSFMPQLLFTLPVDGEKFYHPLGVKHNNLFYVFTLLQAGSALRWEQSAVALDGGSLFLVNNFVSNYDKIVKTSMKAAKKHRIIIKEDEMWQIFADLILLHEIGHSNNYEKEDLRMSDWTEWLANTFMYNKIIDVILSKEQVPDERRKLIFMLMAQADLNKKRLADSEAREYVDSELIFLHLLIKSDLINFNYFNRSIDQNIVLEKLKELIKKCRNFDHLNPELKQIKRKREKIINFWQNYFKS